MALSQIEAKSEQNRKVADLAPDEDIGTKRDIFSVGTSKYYSVTVETIWPDMMTKFLLFNGANL